MKSISCIDKDKCVGCFACKMICPRHCIKHQFDSERLDEYPALDDKMCINCGMCIKVCPVACEKVVSGIDSTFFYLGINTNALIRHNSTSGGIFYALAQYYIDKGYYIYGANLDKEGNVRHILISNISELYKIIGSKYVRSDITDVFLDIKNKLNDNKKVLFVGTGCQCEAVKNFINVTLLNKGCNLVTIDVVCHGVGKPSLWMCHYKELITEFGDINNINFRDKEIGWRLSGLSFFSFREKHFFSGNQDPYINAYAHNLCIRESCYMCLYKGIDRSTDITLGDAWGINKDTDLNEAEGVSLIMVHSSEGFKVINELTKLNIIRIKEIENKEAYLRANPCITKSINRNDNQKKFEMDLKQGVEFKKAINTCIQVPLKSRIVSKIKAVLKKLNR